MNSRFEELDEMEEERTMSYERFEEYGEDFIHIIEDGVPKTSSTWISAEEILEASDADKTSFEEESGNRKFTSVYNLLCAVDVLTAFHDSHPYEIKASEYESAPLIEAWEHVSGNNYSPYANSAPEIEKLYGKS